MARALTEEAWLEHSWDRVRPPRYTAVVEFLRAHGSVRRLNLFGCACVRSVRLHIEDSRFWNALDAAERHAEGRGEVVALEAVRKPLYDALADLQVELELGQVDPRGEDDRALAVIRVVCGLVHEEVPHALEDFLAEPFDYRRLLHEVFGNPFRPVEIAPAWLVWRAGLVEEMAREIYDNRRFRDCPILADALEEAGCAEMALLDHLRGEGHVPGCWALDALLGQS